MILRLTTESDKHIKYVRIIPLWGVNIKIPGVQYLCGIFILGPGSLAASSGRTEGAIVPTLLSFFLS